MGKSSKLKSFTDLDMHNPPWPLIPVKFGLPVRCLSPDADQRPDIVAVSSRISDLMMRLMDGLYTSQNALERRAERDRKRAQKYFLERQKSRTKCHHSILPQVL